MISEAYEQKRNEMKEKYKAIYEGMQEEFPTHTLDDLFDMFIAICRHGEYGLKEVKIVDGKAILVYAGGEVDFDELKKDYAELNGYSDENAKENGLI